MNARYREVRQTVSTRAALRSAACGDLVVSRTRQLVGNRSFCVAGPTHGVEQLTARHSNCSVINHF